MFQHEQDNQLYFGDYVVLYSEDYRGYVFSYQSSSAHNELGVAEGQDRKFPKFLNPLYLVFQICVQNRYKFNKHLPKLRAQVAQDPSNVVLQTQLANAKKSAHEENADNENEQRRQTGKKLLFGQIIQLRHCFTGKYIHVNNTQTSCTEPSNMLVELLEPNAKTALFKIMPRSKVKSEGEIVQVEDQIVVESFKCQSSFLHCSRIPFSDKEVYSGYFELNMSVRQSAFTVFRYYQPPKLGRSIVAPEPEKLNSGCYIRLYHREWEAYLTAEGLPSERILRGGEEIYLRVRPMDQQDPKTMYPSTSANTFWQIQKETTNIDGGPIFWQEQIRLRHATVGMYLKLAAVNGDHRFELTDNFRDNDTIFKIHPVVKDSDWVPYEACIRLEHVVTGKWIHASAQLTKQPGDTNIVRCEPEECEHVIDFSTAQLRKITAVDQMMYDDAFTVQAVTPSMVKEMHFVAGMVPFLQKLVIELRSGIVFTAKRLVKVRRAMKQLTEFLDEDGIPCKRRQKLLRNYLIIDLCVELLRCQTRNTANEQTMAPVLSDCLTLLYGYLHGDSRKNELYIGRHMDFFMNQIQDEGTIGLNTAKMCVEMINNNRKLVSRITKEHIERLCNMLKKNRNYRYMELLMALCICDGITLFENQNYIMNELIMEPARTQKEIIYFTTLGQKIDLEENVVYVWYDNNEKWRSLYEFANQNSHSERYLFLEYQLKLYAALCHGRNEFCIDQLVCKLQYVVWDEVFLCLTDDSMLDPLRACYCDLLLNIFVDSGDNRSVRDQLNLVYIYADVQPPDRKPGVVRKRKPKNRARSQSPFRKQSDCQDIPLLSSTEQLTRVKEWISEFLSANSHMVASNEARNLFLAKVLELVANLATYGYYTETEEIRTLVQPMMEVIDGRDDLPYPIDDWKKASPDVVRLIDQYQKEGRFKKNPHNSAMVEVKYQAIQVLQFLFTLRFNVRMEQFVAEFKNAVSRDNDHTITPSELAPFLRENFNYETNALSYQRIAIKYLTNIFNSSKYVDASFTDILMDLCGYENYPQLVSEAMLLINAQYSQFETLFTFASQTQVLVTDKSCKTLAQVRDMLPVLRVKKKQKMSQENVAKICAFLEKLSRMCVLESDIQEPHVMNQNILYNHGILNDISDLLISRSREMPSSIQRLGFAYLKLLARGNSKVQNRIFEWIGTLFRIEGADDYLADLYFEIFGSNKDMCMRLLPQHINEYVKRVADSGSPMMIRLCSSIVNVGNTPLKRNQSLVIQALLQNRGTIDFIVEKSPEERYALLSLEEARMTPLQMRHRNYFCAMTQLLAFCAKGENRTVESICQCMFTLDELLKIITLPNLCAGLKGPFVQFFHAVFLTATSDMYFDQRDLSHHPKIMKFADIVSIELHRAAEYIREHKSMAHQFLRRRPARLHNKLSDAEHEMRELLHYIFDAALPVFSIFFRAFYNKDDHVKSGFVLTPGEINLEPPGLAAARTIAERSIVENFLENAVRFAKSVRPVLTNQLHLEALQELFRNLAKGTPELGKQFPMPTDISRGLDPESSEMKTYFRYYSEEKRLNEMLRKFVKNLETAYGGLNTIQIQIGFPCNAEYITPDEDEPLPMGREFQSLVNSFLNYGCDSSDVRFANVRKILKHLENSLSFGKLRESRRVMFEALDCKCLQILRALIHNEIVKLPPDREKARQQYDRQMAAVEEVQKALTNQEIVRIVLPHLNKPSDEVVRESLATLSVLLWGGNNDAQQSFHDYFSHTREETFFFVVRRRIQLSGDFVKERRALLSQKKAMKYEREEFLSGFQEKKERGSISGFSASFQDPIEEQGMLGLFMRTLTAAIGMSDGEEKEDPTMTKISGLTDGSLGQLQNNLLNAAELGKNISNHVFPDSNQARWDVADESETLPSGRDNGFIDLLLRLLASLCDGQYEPMQEYMREQRDNIKSVNVLGEIVNFLALIYASVDSQSIGLVTQVFDTLIEMAQGNHVNQICMFDHKVVDYINFLLRINDFPGCKLVDVYQMRRSVLVLLIDITEENSMSGHTKYIMESVSKDELYKTLTNTYLIIAPRNRKKGRFEDMEQDLKDLVTTVGYLCHHLLCRASDLDSSVDLNRYSRNPAWRYFHGRTMSVEIQKGDSLQRVYFTVGDKSALRKNVMERLKWEVNRSSSTGKLRDFLAWSSEIRKDIQYQRKVQQHTFARLLVNKWILLNHIVLGITFLICTILLVSWKSPTVVDPLYEYSVDEGKYRPFRSSFLDFPLILLGILHNVFSVMMLASFLLANHPVMTMPGIVKLGMRLGKLSRQGLDAIWARLMTHAAKKGVLGVDPSDTDHLDEFDNEMILNEGEGLDGDSNEEALKTAQAELQSHPPSTHLTVDLLSFQSIYYICFVFLSLLASTWNFGFFSFHMLHICQNNQLLSRVILAVTLNGKSMLWVVFLGIIIFYIFTIVGFLFLRNVYSENSLFCSTLWECFVTTIREGLMYGMADHFDIPDSSDFYTYSNYAYKTIYDIAFFALVTTIGLNIIFGIIVDTFSQLRDNKWQVELDMRSTCFICGRGSYEFEHHGRGFQRHIREEHNMWAYLFFFIHLDDTPQNDLTCLELFTFKMMESNSIEFFPLGRALTLSQWEQSNTDARLDVLIDQVKYLVAKMQKEEHEKLRAAEFERQLKQRRDFQESAHREADRNGQAGKSRTFGGIMRKKTQDAKKSRDPSSESISHLQAAAEAGYESATEHSPRHSRSSTTQRLDRSHPAQGDSLPSRLRDDGAGTSPAASGSNLPSTSHHGHSHR